MVRPLCVDRVRCRPNVLTAAHYGAPCTRQRIVLLAARKGEKLPSAPRCTHNISLPRRRGLLAWRNLFVHSSPHLPPARTRRDAISDLPAPANGGCAVEYTHQARNDFQVEMRADNQSVDGHIGLHRTGKTACSVSVVRHPWINQQTRSLANTALPGDATTKKRGACSQLANLLGSNLGLTDLG